MMKFAFAVALMATAIFSPADQIDQLAQRTMTNLKIPGLAIAVIRNGKVTTERCYGQINLEVGAKTTPDSIFEVGSVTKQFVSFALLKEVEKGNLTLDEPIGKILPDLPDAWQKIQVGQMLSHTAGLKDYLASVSMTDMTPKSEDQVIGLVSKAAVDFAPGAGWSYSNMDYFLAGMMVEKFEKVPLKTALENLIFKPLGMTETGNIDRDAVLKNRASGYAYLPTGKYRNMPAGLDSTFGGAGFLRSSIKDMEKWAICLQKENILRPSSYELWEKEAVLDNGVPCGYALGWFINHDGPLKIVEHAGNSYGCSAEVYRVPAENETVVCLCNASGIELPWLAREVISLDIPALNLVTRKPVPDPHKDFTERLKLAVSKRNLLPDVSPTFKAELRTLRGLSYSSLFYSLGDSFKNLTYLDGQENGESTISRYRLPGEGGDLYLNIVYDRDGKLANVSVMDIDFHAPKKQKKADEKTSKDSQATHKI